MNEGFLGKHTLSGERAATGDHPVVLHHLPLSEKASIPVWIRPWYTRSPSRSMTTPLP